MQEWHSIRKSRVYSMWEWWVHSELICNDGWLQQGLRSQSQCVVVLDAYGRRKKTMWYKPTIEADEAPLCLHCFVVIWVWN